MKKRASAPHGLLAALGLTLVFGLQGCAMPLSFAQTSGVWSGTASNEVDMGISAFAQQRVTINAGQSVVFVDPTNTGGVHFICVGKNLTCAPTPGTPPQLATPTGMLFSNGDKPVSIPFEKPGTYQVICTIHPGMQVTIVVK